MSSSIPLDEKPNRLASLDAFRGLTIAMMILVNNPGTWQAIYPPLRHAEWHGWTLTDLIFPFFLFIVGVAIVFAFSKRIKKGIPKTKLYTKILRRTLILFGLGLFLNGFSGLSPLAWKIYIGLFIAILITYLIIQYLIAQELKEKYLSILKRVFQLILIVFVINSLFYFDFASLRIPGVLQRIALCYAISSIIVLNTDIKKQIYIAAGILILYWLIMKVVPVPGYGAGVLEPKGNLAWFIDSNLLAGHTWSGAPVEGFDPEGLLTTLPAIATVLLGVLTGHWLKTDKNDYEKVSGLFVAGVFGLLAGIIIDIWFPINKNLWSSSYVLFSGGMALLFLATLYWLVDIKSYKKYSKPFIVFGANAIIMYSISTFFAIILGSLWEVQLGEELIPMKTYLFEKLFASWLSPVNASLLYAISYLFIFYIIAKILYKKRIYIKV